MPFETITPAALTIDDVQRWFTGDLHASPDSAAYQQWSILPGESVTYSSGTPRGKEGHGPGEGIEQPEYLQNLHFHRGDHWQGGRGWPGQFPTKADNTIDSVAVGRIAGAFISENVVRQVEHRHNSGVLGRSPTWDIAEHDSQGEEVENTELQEIRQQVENWLQDRGFIDRLSKFVEHLDLGGTGAIRRFIPPGKLARMLGIDVSDIEEGTPLQLPSMTFDQALGLIRIANVEPGEGGVYEEPETGDRYAGYVYELAKDRKAAEVSYILPDGTTQMVTITSDEKRYLWPALDLAGALNVYQRRRDVLITAQVRQHQRLLNKARTLLNTNLDWSGFLERIFLNAQPPTRKIDGEDVPVYNAGAGTASFIRGVTYTDEQGNTRVAPPQVVFREPIKSDLFRDSAEQAREGIYHETDQLHALIAGDAVATGESRIQAKAGFLTSLFLTKPAVDGVGKWVIESVVRLAAALSGTKLPEGIRFTFRCRLDPGPLSPDETRAVIERVKSGLSSKRAALGDLRTEDVEAELAAIEAEARETTLPDLVKKWMDAGLSLRGALRACGLEEEEVQRYIAFDAADAPPAP